MSTAVFQFTRPAWGATPRSRPRSRSRGFNSRAPHGARRARPFPARQGEVSIHAPRMGRDAEMLSDKGLGSVSIHAPRMGRDLCSHPRLVSVARFNSRAPHGARRAVRDYVCRERKFQFTRPAWGATLNRRGRRGAGLFQFTRPAWGATTWARTPRQKRQFQFTRPAWGATL